MAIGYKLYIRFLEVFSSVWNFKLVNGKSNISVLNILRIIIRFYVFINLLTERKRQNRFYWKSIVLITLYCTRSRRFVFAQYRFFFFFVFIRQNRTRAHVRFFFFFLWTVSNLYHDRLSQVPQVYDTVHENVRRKDPAHVKYAFEICYTFAGSLWTFGADGSYTKTM